VRLVLTGAQVPRSSFGVGYCQPASFAPHVAAKLAHFRSVATVDCRHCHCPIGRFRLAFASGKRKQLPHLFSQLDAPLHLGLHSRPCPCCSSCHIHFSPLPRSFLPGGDIFRIAVYHKLFHWGVVFHLAHFFLPPPSAHSPVRHCLLVCVAISLQFSRFPPRLCVSFSCSVCAGVCISVNFICQRDAYVVCLPKNKRIPL